MCVFQESKESKSQDGKYAYPPVSKADLYACCHFYLSLYVGSWFLYVDTHRTKLVVLSQGEYDRMRVCKFLFRVRMCMGHKPTERFLNIMNAYTVMSNSSE